MLERRWRGKISPPRRHAQDDSNRLVYADFEKMENNRPVSARGGFIQLFAYQESDVHKSTFKGLEGADPPAPELVRVKKDDPNHAMKFDLLVLRPEPVGRRHGRNPRTARRRRQARADDVSGYKRLSLQVYATGIEILRLEAISRGRARTWRWATRR